MEDIVFSTIKNEGEIEILRDKQSFNYKFDDNTIGLLKKLFTSNDSLYLIAKKDDEFAGFCSIDRDWWEDNFFFLREILVDSKFKKFGIGKELMKRCVEHAKSKKATGVITETDFKNIPMQKLCEKFDFERWDNPKWKRGVTYRLLF